MSIFGCKGQRLFRAVILLSQSFVASAPAVTKAVHDTAPLHSVEAESGDREEGLSAEGLKLWKAHVKEAETHNLLPGCTPIKLLPRKGTYKGIVVLYHGFTSCPAQFDALARKLVAAGYEVLMPLLPGHGHQRNPDRSDDISDLPRTKEPYKTFVQKMNQVMTHSRGDKLVGGLSVGGDLATYAMLTSPIYKRALLLSPFYEASDQLGNRLKLTTFGNIPHIEDYAKFYASGFHWGNGCRDKRDLNEVLGYCDWDPVNINAARDLGHEVRGLATSPSRLNTEIQMVVAGHDKAANNAWSLQMAQILKKRDPAVFDTVYDGVPHASVEVDPTAPAGTQWWLPGFNQQAADFLIDGRSFPIEPGYTQEGFPLADALKL